MQFFAGLFLVVWFGGIFYILFSNIFRRYNEKQLYKDMISNPNDRSVNDYIEAFEKINGFASSVFNLFFSSQHTSDKIRQAQGYDIVRKSQAVSYEVKESLKVAFIANGVKIR